MVRAYLDQLSRSNGLAPEKLAAARTALARAEQLSGQARHDALAQLATQLKSDSQGGAPRTLVTAVADLAEAAR